MSDDTMLMTEEQKKALFSGETEKLVRATDCYLKDFYPSYLITNESLEKMELEDSCRILSDKFQFFRIVDCTIDRTSNTFEVLSEKIKKLFIMAYSINCCMCYGIVSYNKKTSLVVGIEKKEKNSQEAISKLMEGILPGIHLTSIEDRLFENSENNGRETDRHVGFISGIPIIKENNKIKQRDLSYIMRTLNGQNYTMLTVCKPINLDQIQNKISIANELQDKCFSISKRTLSLSNGSAKSNTTSESDAHGIATTKGWSFSFGGGVGIDCVNLCSHIGFFASRTVSDTHTVGKSLTDTINNNESISGEIQNSFAIDLMKMCETVSSRLKIGRNIGMWNAITSYSSESEVAADIIKGSLYSEFASDNKDILPPVSFQYKDSYLNKIDGKVRHNQHVIISKGFFEDKSDPNVSSILTSEELCAVCSIPTESTVGFSLNENKDYQLTCESESGSIEIGNICEYDRPIENSKFSLSKTDLNKHTFVCGITGSGKTNTVKNILQKVDVPFLVLEPAKKEYRNLNLKDLKVYSLGRPELNCLRINPFYILPGTSPQHHIDLLKDLFNASFGLYGPMPYILEKCLNNIYINKGWNLTLGYHPKFVDNESMDNMFSSEHIGGQYNKKSHIYLFPTMQDLKNEIDSYVDSMSYEGEVKGNIQGALKARIDSLCVGSKSYMFNNNEPINMEDLLNSKSVIELEGLSDDSDKAFGLGLLIIFINEQRENQRDITNEVGLKHLLVIEEAHRLLKNVSSEANEEIGNPKGKAVEHFTNLLAEMRSYGQGVIIAEQIPSKLAPEVIKNTSNKIVHRLVAKDDQEIISNTIGINIDDSIYLGSEKTGMALCHKEGMSKPVYVKIDQADSVKIVKDVNLYQNNLDSRMSTLNENIISSSFNNELDIWAIKTIVSLMYFDDYNKIYYGMENFNKTFDYLIERENTVLISSSYNKKDCLLNCLLKNICKLLSVGLFSNGKIVEDDLIKDIENILNNPTDEKLKNLKEKFETFYGQKPSKKVVNLIALLSRNELKNDEKFKAAGNSYLFFNDDNFINDMRKILLEG